MSLDDLIEADRVKKERTGAGGGASDPGSTPPPASKDAELQGGETKKKGNRPGQRARRAAGKRAEKAGKEG
eukprot:1844935-Alexandrium_andersonii.AAC.1